jgi:hypothetical protein
VQGLAFVLPMNSCTKIPALRQAAKRYVPYCPTVSPAMERQQKCSLSFRFDLTQSLHQLDSLYSAFVEILFFGTSI